jgi:hypothetical protein
MKKSTIKPINKLKSNYFTNNLIKILNSKYDKGLSLFDIYEELKEAYGILDGNTLMSRFLFHNKDNKEIMEEMHRTAFIIN